MATHIVVEQDAPTRITLSIQGELWDGFAEIGRIEVDVVKRLDRRVSITVVEVD
nr:hypothetical protein [Chloroflexota bacterium]